jgi:hypothetical protein
MLTKKEKTKYRSTLFSHLDGIASATSAFSLYKKGVLNHLYKSERATLEELSKKFNANKGYLNVGLRVLCSQGWLTQVYENESIIFKINNNSKKAFELIPLFEDAIILLNYSIQFPEDGIGADAFNKLEIIFKKLTSNYGLKEINHLEQQILTHIEGLVIAPIIVLLGLKGMFHKYFMEASFRAQEYHKDPESFKKILDFFVHLKWFTKKKRHLSVYL